MLSKSVVLSAYSCDPSKGSEPGNGYNWADQLAKYGHKVYCITTSKGKAAITRSNQNNPNLEMAYVDLPLGLDKIYFWTKLGMYSHYLIWQWLAYKHAKKLLKTRHFNLAHHVTWGSLQQGSFMYKLPIPFLFGPAGGGQKAPEAYKSYFKEHWQTELKREKISNLLLKVNPACKAMVKKAKVIFTSNQDTAVMAKKMGAKHVVPYLDAALPKTFFKDTTLTFEENRQELKLLWVGRFLPRKGILLVLDVMKALINHPNITLTVVGDGDMKDDFLDKRKAYNLEDKVNWVGRVPFEAVRSYYKSHDAFLFTSLRDSGGVQLIEAMAFGLPVITLNLHGQGLMINDDRGFTASVDTPDKTIKELSNFIENLQKDRKKLKRLSENAHNYALKQTLENKVKKISEKFY
ncbi:glycosyltransferase family 4 protein [Hyunsoonleella sp. 2307UL5-6]|uniref:glycosyltransferase family 4 protein n=1 Tax=Hyunsoonleella sp. 2307UL5-6 TaxID=3384768 RepID=UPI0039BCCF7B